MQLVGATVSMYDPMKDRQIGIPEVIEKWGVPPEKMIDLQAMTGDSVDNVPGIPGIGPKTAAQLLETYGDLDTLLARASEIKQDKRRETIIANADKARISRELVTLKADVPIAEGLDDFALQPPNGPKLIGFLKTMEFSTLTRRVAEATGTDLAAIDAVPVKVEGAAEAHGPDMGAGGIALRLRRNWRLATSPPARAVWRRPPMVAPPRRPQAKRPRPHPPRWPRCAPRLPWPLRSTPMPMFASATCRRSRHGSPRRAKRAWLRSTPRQRRPIRCRPISSASRWRRDRDAPPTCRSRTGPAPPTCSAAACWKARSLCARRSQR